MGNRLRRRRGRSVVAGMAHARITLKMLGAQLGVSHTTVSLALRNHPSISAATRRRVLAAARKAGYRPDPMLSSLVAYRLGARPHAFQGVLGWLTNFPTSRGWCIGQQVGYHAGAQKRAQELGYNLAEFWLREPGLTPRRLRQILVARHVQGLIVAAQPEPHTRIEFGWEDFAAVSLGYSLATPKLHLVMNHQFQNMLALIQRLVARGYRSIGLAMPASRDERVEHNYLAGYLMGLHAAPAVRSFRPFFPQQIERAGFLEWHRLNRPEVVITEAGCARSFLQWLGTDGVRIPRSAGLALVNCPYQDERFSGINEDPELVGSTAVDVVVGMLHRHEFGIPKNAKHVLIQGTWQPGRTIRSRLPVTL